MASRLEIFSRNRKRRVTVSIQPLAFGQAAGANRCSRSVAKRAPRGQRPRPLATQEAYIVAHMLTNLLLGQDEILGADD